MVEEKGGGIVIARFNWSGSVDWRKLSGERGGKGGKGERRFGLNHGVSEMIRLGEVMKL